MSRGPGRIERAIEDAFKANPNCAFTGEELVLLVFRGVNRVEKKHRLSVFRAANTVAKRLLWRTMKGGDTGDGRTFYNPVDVRSYVQAHLRYLQRDYLRYGKTERLEQELAALDDESIEVSWRHYMKPSGAWWEWVELERCRRSGDDAR